MKTRLLLCFLFISFAVFSGIAQVPQGFNYQAVARDGSGNPITNTTLQVKISILSDTTGFYANGTGTYIWEEQHSVRTNSFGIFILAIGTGTKIQGSAATFSVVPWTTPQLFIGTKINYPTWKQLGSAKLWSVPYAMVSEKANGVNEGAKLSVKSNDDLGKEALFEVKRKDGQTVFAVYPDAVNVYVPRSGGKGAKGGFAIGGFDGSKADLQPQDYFRVTPDSVRIYIDPTPNVKGAKGGFAIGGYGGDKGISDMYFNLTGAATVNTVKASPQILWYPKKNAFLAGNVHIGAVDSVGDYSTALGYQSIAMGDYSQAFGYKTMALGDYSTAIGKRSIAGARSKDGLTSIASSAFALGNGAQATGDDSYAFGSGAKATGLRSFAFGSVGIDAASGNPTGTPTQATQPYSIAFGMGAQATSKGALALGVGSLSSGYLSSSLGYGTVASGSYSLSLGFSSDATANYSVAIGYNAQSSDLAATAIGYNANASNQYAIAIGNSNISAGVSSIAFGNSNTSDGSNSIAIGNNSTSSNDLSTAIGYYAQATGVKSVSVGANYSKTIVIKPVIPIIRPPIVLPKGGDVFDPNQIPLSGGETKGGYIIINPVINRNNIAEGEYSLAVGNGNYASNGGSAFGVFNDASAQFATTIGFGNQAIAVNSFAAGYANKAEGEFSTAIGRYTNATSENSFAIGRYNVSVGNSTTWVETDPLFQIGNGSSATDSHDAFRVLKNGGTYVNSTNAYSGLWVINKNTADNPNSTFGLGIMSGIQRNKAGLTYYSGYFYSAGGTEGTYKGLYADLINTPEINATKINGVSSDVAEYIYDTYANTEPADVVIADPNNKISVTKSERSYQTSVVGVISTKPMLTMGNELISDETTGDPLPNPKPCARLALTGRVPVKVTGENGAIVPGDYVTTSSTPGHAMKWTLLDVNTAKDFDDLKKILSENERRRNAIIGKAVESFSGSGTGKIMVLISLQ
jgi:hypothetical protein